MTIHQSQFTNHYCLLPVAYNKNKQITKQYEETFILFRFNLHDKPDVCPRDGDHSPERA